MRVILCEDSPLLYLNDNVSSVGLEEVFIKNKIEAQTFNFTYCLIALSF